MEVIAIVFSILLAFTIDAWWDGVLEDREERTLLLRLKAEFEVNERRLEDVRMGHEAVAAASHRLLEIMHPSPPEVQPAVIDQLFNEMGRWRTYDPVSGTINTVLASGDLRLIRDDVLRIELAGWPDLVEDLNEDERVDRDQVVGRIIPFLERSFNYRAVIYARDSTAVTPTAFARDYTRVLASEELEGIVAARLWRVREILREAELVQASLERILSRVEQGH